MSVFPKISLRPEVADYLKGVFMNKEVCFDENTHICCHGSGRSRDYPNGVSFHCDHTRGFCKQSQHALFTNKFLEVKRKKKDTLHVQY